MRKSNTKKTDLPKEIESNNPTNETEKGLIGTQETKMKTTSSMSLIDSIKQLNKNPVITKVVLDDLSEDNLNLLNWLWDNKYIITVASDDIVLLNKTNAKIINLSGSMGRWRIVSYAQALIEPCEIYIMFKKVNDAQAAQIKSSKIIKAEEYQTIF